jgi:hypothetical protein
VTTVANASTHPPTHTNTIGMMSPVPPGPRTGCPQDAPRSGDLKRPLSKSRASAPPYGDAVPPPAGRSDTPTSKGIVVRLEPWEGGGPCDGAGGGGGCAVLIPAVSACRKTRASLPAPVRHGTDGTALPPSPPLC